MSGLLFSRIPQPRVPYMRSRFFGHPDLLHDWWDEMSYHYLVTNDTDLLGLARLTPVHDGCLPFMDFVKGKNEKLQQSDVEIGRFVIAESARHTRVGWFLFKNLVKCVSSFSPCSAYVYVDVMEGRMISDRSLCRLGFTKTTARYFDTRYGGMSSVHIAPLSRLLTYVNEKGES